MAVFDFRFVFYTLSAVGVLFAPANGLLTRGRLGNVWIKGYGSIRETIKTIKTDSMARCLMWCLTTKGCTGINTYDDVTGMLACELKNGLPSSFDLVPMRDVRFISTLTMAHSCAEHYEFFHHTESGIYDINIVPDSDRPPDVVSVYCDMKTDLGKWMMLLRRIDNTVSFDRSWNDYLSMFGNLNGNLWMGLDFMHRVTSRMGLDYELRIDMLSFPRLVNGNFTGIEEQGYAKYRTFSIGDAASFYKINIDRYTGNWGDSMASINGMPFTANGSANDHDLMSVNCAEVFGAPWWYGAGADSRLTGEYGMVVPDHYGMLNNAVTIFYHGIMWTTHLGSQEHPSFVEMKIRPR